MASAFNESTGDVGLLSQLQGNQRLSRFKRWYTQSARADQEFHGDVLKGRRYLSNDQWSEGTRTTMGKKRRPMLTINKILPRILFLKGVQLSQREEPSIVPQEGGDARNVELISALYKWFATRTREARADSAVFDQKITAGLGFWKITWDFDQDPEGYLCIASTDPLSLYVDPNWLDAGWDSALYCIHSVWKDPEEAMAEWPEHRDKLQRDVGEWLQSGGVTTFGDGDFSGDSMASERSFWDPQTQRLRVLEIWYKQRDAVDAVMKMDSGEVSTDEERISAVQMATAQDPSLNDAFQFFRQSVSRVRVAHITENILLDDQPSPYREPCFPFFPTRAYYWQRKPFGAVLPLMDLQDETNKRRSTVAEMVNRAALSGFFNQESQGADPEQLENYAAGTAKVIPYKTVKPEVIDPPQLPQAVIFLDRAADQDMDKVSNINAELLGTTSARTVSGKAIKARQQSGMIVQEPLLSTFREDKEPAVRFGIKLIQQFCSLPRAARILGTILQRSPDGQLAQMLNPMMAQLGGLLELRDLLQGAFDTDYDVAITSKPFDPSAMQQRADRLTEMASEFPGYVDPELVVNAIRDAGGLSPEDAEQALQFIKMRLQMDQAQQLAATAGQAPAPPNRAAAA